MKDKSDDAAKKIWPVGCGILLIHMLSDDPRSIPDNTRGIVEFIDDIGTIHCRFEGGRCLGVIPGVDIYRILSEED